MAFIKTDMFYLIRFRQRPYSSVNEYACVPSSWIVRRADRIVHVAYPKEDPEETKRRAEAKETPGKDWDIIEAEVDYQSVTFVNADSWSTMEKVEQSTDEDEIVIVEDEDSTDSANDEIAITPNTSIKNESNMQTGGKLVRNPLAAFREQMPAAEKNTSNRNNTLTESSKKEVTNKEVEETLPTHNNPSTQEIVGKTTMKEDVEKLSSFLIKAKKIIAQSNQRQLSKSKHQQRISVVSENVLRYSRNKAPLPESIEINSTQVMKPATQTLLNLAKKSQLSQIIKENTLKITGQPPHGKLHGIPDRPAQVNCIQKSTLPKVNKDTSPVPNYTNSADLPYPLLHQQNIQPSPAHYDHLQKKGTNKVGKVIKSSTGSRVIGYEGPRQTVLKNAAPAEQNVSNPANQPDQAYKQTHEEQSQQAYDVFIQTNSNVNKIIITNSKVAANAQRIPSSISKNAIVAEQNFLNQAKRLSDLYKHWEQQLPLDSREHLPQNPSTENVLLKTTTAGVSQNNTKSKVQNFPSIDQLPKASNQYLKPAVMQNNGRHVAHTRCVSHAGESAAANSLNQRPGFRDMRQNIPTSLPNPQTNQLLQISRNSHENQPPPVIKAYLLQDPQTKLLFLRAATRVNDGEHKLSVQSTTKKVPAPQTVPSTNQSSQPYNQSYKNQFSVDGHDAELQNLRAQQIFQRRPNTMQNGYPQNSIPNIPLTVNPSYSVTHQPCPCLCSHGRPVTSVAAKHPMAKQDPHVQISLITESTAGNGEKRVNPATDTDNRFAKKPYADDQRCTQENQISVLQSSCRESSTRNKPAAHCSKDLANQQVELSMAGQNSPINVDSSDKVIFTEKAPVNKIRSSKSPLKSSLQTKTTAIASKDKLNNTLHDYKLLLSQMNSNISGTLEACNDMQSTITEYNKSFKNIIGKVTDLCQLKIDQIHSTRSKKVEKPQNKLKRRKVMKNDGGNYLDDRHQGNENKKSRKNNEACNKPLKKKRRQAKVQKEANSFVLPPEYDPDNSRWTLKHQKAAPGLVEVIPRGRVYIDAINFKYCKRTAKDCRTLARMLLTEIFSENALRVCSLTGAKAKAFFDQDVRPGLDEQARIIMLTFVEDYGRKHGWVVYDKQSVLNSVRSKLQEIRNKAN